MYYSTPLFADDIRPHDPHKMLSNTRWTTTTHTPDTTPTAQSTPRTRALTTMQSPPSHRVAPSSPPQTRHLISGRRAASTGGVDRAMVVGWRMAAGGDRHPFHSCCCRYCPAATTAAAARRRPVGGRDGESDINWWWWQQLSGDGGNKQRGGAIGGGRGSADNEPLSKKII